MRIKLSFTCKCGSGLIVTLSPKWEQSQKSFLYTHDHCGTTYHCTVKEDGAVVAKTSFIIGKIIEE